MKVITEPKATVVGATTFFPHPDYDIPLDGDESVQLCAFAAKACYDSFGREGRANEENQSQIVAMRHGSVLEHYHVSLFIEGITRGLSLELNRHRHFNISQRSTRYTAEEDAAIVLEPYFAELQKRKDKDPDFNDAEDNVLFDHIEQCEFAIKAYITQVDDLMSMNPMGLSGVALRKWARGKARNVLPHALETRGTWTNNIRGWRHFLEMRSDRHAEAEIRRLAEHVFDALSTVVPFYLQDYEPVYIDGYPEYVTKNRKV